MKHAPRGGNDLIRQAMCLEPREGGGEGGSGGMRWEGRASPGAREALAGEAQGER